MMTTPYPTEHTPVFTPLVQEVGLVCAAVYGAVWRQCQRDDKVCHASLITLGKEINVNRATVMRSIKTLCDLGYLTDQTPGLRNVPHTYILAKTVAYNNTSIAEEDKSVVIRNSLNGSTVAESSTTVAHNNSLPQTVAESHLKNPESLNPKESNRESQNRARETFLKKLKRIGEVDFLNQNQPFAVKLSEICGNPGPEYVVNGERRKLAEVTAQLLDWNATAEQLEKFRTDWDTWADSPPLFDQVVKRWGRFLTSLTAPPKPTSNGHGPPVASPALSSEQKRALVEHMARDAKEIYDPRS